MAEPESGSMVPVDLAECQAMVNGLPEEETEYQHDIGQIEVHTYMLLYVLQTLLTLIEV